MRNVYSVFMESLSPMKTDVDTQKDTSQLVNHSQHRGETLTRRPDSEATEAKNTDCDVFEVANVS